MEDKKKEISEYLTKNVNIFVEPMVYELVKKRPSDPSGYALNWLK